MWFPIIIINSILLAENYAFFNIVVLFPYFVTGFVCCQSYTTSKFWFFNAFTNCMVYASFLSEKNAELFQKEIFWNFI